LPPPRDLEVLLEVRDVNAMIVPSPVLGAPMPVLVLELEDGREFTLYHVPYEIVRALNNLRSGSDSLGGRESIFDVFASMKDLVEELGKSLESVVVDELDYNTGLYTAKAYFRLGGLQMMRRMIPSHAIFLAVLFGRPIYVSRRLVDAQAEMGAVLSDEVSEEEEEEF